jgi:DNA invertase Pin-like site-specific DNA recombinase
MAIYGYARVSTQDQTTDIQEATLKQAGCEIVRSETASATSMTGRTELATLLAFLRTGDTLMVTRLDRLARSVADLHTIAAELRAKGIHLRTVEHNIDTATATGGFFLAVLAAVAEFETNLRRERQMEGIAAAKKRGVYKGRRQKVNSADVLRLHSEGKGATSIARFLKIGRATVYTHLKRARSAAPDAGTA